MSTPPAPATGQAAARPFSVPLPARTHSPADRPTRAVPPPPAHGQATPDRRGHPGSYARVDLRPDPAAAAQARRVTRDTLARWDMRHLTDDTEAVASELAANAINAATPPRRTLPAIIFAIHHRPTELIIIVWDNGPGHPQHDAAGPTPRPGGAWPSSTTSPAASGDGGPPPKAVGKSSGRRSRPQTRPTPHRAC